MLFMPGDGALIPPIPHIVLATFLAEDWTNEQADIKKLADEAQALLTAIDLAISRHDFAGDAEGRKMRVSWALIGPGFFRKIEAIRTASSAKRDYTELAVITTALTLRQQTLEANGIEVLKKA
jgi:hypothetical protein